MRVSACHRRVRSTVSYTFWRSMKHMKRVLPPNFLQPVNHKHHVRVGAIWSKPALLQREQSFALQLALNLLATTLRRTLPACDTSEMPRPDVGRDVFSVKQDGALSGGESLAGIPEGGKPREQPASLGEASPAEGVPQGGVLEHPVQSMLPDCEYVEATLAGSLPLQHHGPSRHQVTPAATRADNASQSIRERNDVDCTHLVEIATDSTLSELRRLGLYTKAVLTNIAHQADEAEPVVECACAATKVQMYSAGEKTEVVPNNFEEDTIIGSRWVYKINAENSIGQPRLMPTTLERPSPSRQGTVISAPETLTSGNAAVSMGMPNIDDRDLGRRVDDGKRSAGTDGIKNGVMDYEKGGDDEGDP